MHTRRREGIYFEGGALTSGDSARSDKDVEESVKEREGSEGRK